MKKLLPALVCGFAAGVLNTVPHMKTICLSFCLVIPMAAFFALVLHQKANRSDSDITASFAVLLGFWTGIFAAFFSTAFDVLLIFLTRDFPITSSLSDFEEWIKSIYPAEVAGKMIIIIRRMADDFNRYGFSTLYTFFVLIGYLIIDSIFGIIGGLIGMQIINRRKDSGENNF